jgi:hypothetical protein
MKEFRHQRRFDLLVTNDKVRIKLGREKPRKCPRTAKNRRDKAPELAFKLNPLK